MPSDYTDYLWKGGIAYERFRDIQRNDNGACHCCKTVNKLD